ncbi:hypothetical protein AEAC466_14310 [Asticcacaulis sp. AC466]|nr:hypothetical protein AEAC466_14310 [Asticcacaulis sp. AC466]
MSLATDDQSIAVHAPTTVGKSGITVRLMIDDRKVGLNCRVGGIKRRHHKQDGGEGPKARQQEFAY